MIKRMRDMGVDEIWIFDVGANDAEGTGQWGS